MLTNTHLISDLLCDRLYYNDSYLGDFFQVTLTIDNSILALSFRSISTVILKASPLACRFQLSRTFSAATTSTLTMAKDNKNNNNDKDKDLSQDERDRRQQVREERERRRALASMGKADLVVVPPDLRNLFGHANNPAGEIPSTATVSQRAPHPAPSSAAALDAAAAVPLPDQDDIDSDELLASDDEAARDPPPYEEDEDGMEVDDDDLINPAPKWNVIIVREAPHDGELDVGPSRPWIPSSLKDGTNPPTVREIAIQCDYGGASLIKRRKHLKASRQRHDKKRREKTKAEKKSARESSQQVPHPDATASQTPPSQPAASSSQTGSSGGPVPPAASRRREEAPPAKKARQGQPPKKKEDKEQPGRRFSPVRAPAPEPEKHAQPSSSSGGPCTPRRQVDFHHSTQYKPAPKASQSRKEEASRVRHHAPQKRPRSTSYGPRMDSSTAKMIEVFVRGMSEAFRASRQFDRSPSPHYSGDHRTGSHHHYHHDDRARFDQEEEEYERGRSGSRRRSRSRSQSRGRSRDRRPPPYRGKGKGRGKGRGK